MGTYKHTVNIFYLQLFRMGKPLGDHQAHYTCGVKDPKKKKCKYCPDKELAGSNSHNLRVHLRDCNHAPLKVKKAFGYVPKPGEDPEENVFEALRLNTASGSSLSR